jgi:Trypsin
MQNGISARQLTHRQKWMLLSLAGVGVLLIGLISGAAMMAKGWLPFDGGNKVPIGVGQTVTMGIISAKGRTIRAGSGSFEDFLQTDASINRGNSGGALVNLRAELIGVPSQIVSQTGGNIGIGFAIPTAMARTVMDQLIRGGKIQRGKLGITISPLTPDRENTKQTKWNETDEKGRFFVCFVPFRLFRILSFN